MELAGIKEVNSSPLYALLHLTGLSHLLGYVSIRKDSSGNYWQNEFIGKDGLEKRIPDKIKGENGSKIMKPTPGVIIRKIL